MSYNLLLISQSVLVEGRIRNDNKKGDQDVESNIVSKINIALNASQFTWGGGLEVLHLYALALKTHSSKNQLFLLLQRPDNLIGQIKDSLYSQKNKLSNLLGLKNVNLPITNFQMASRFQDITSKIIYYQDINDLNKKLILNQIDITLPFLDPPPRTLSTPWLGYIFDLQHKILPDFFSKSEIKERNERFGILVKKAKYIITDSEAVKKDINHFYPKHSAQIIPLPFVPTLSCPPKLLRKKDLLKKYNLPSKYFIICNQFWIHKDHSTAFRAFSLLNSKHKNVHLVCTGKTHDYRFPEYFNQIKSLIEKLKLEKRIHILGFISKQDQLSLLKHSQGLIQPTQFEGSPGALATQDAISLGVPVIASDISVNKEIIGKNIFFFKVSNPISLSYVICKLLKSPPGRTSSKHLNQYNQQQLELLGSSLQKIIKSILT